MKIMVYGYGNPGRQDDGLGVALCQRLEAWAAENRLTGIDFDNNYQLNIEDAAAIAEYDLVIFADASVEEIEDFCVTRVDGEAEVSFTTHAASPGYILQLCKQLFDREPVALLVHIKGYQWAFEEGLSDQAAQNLDAAFACVQTLLAEPERAIELLDGIKTC